MSNLQTALEIAKNYPIFPCKPDKSPYTKRGYLDASQAAAQVTAWWKQHPAALIGIPTGNASGFLVVDIDRKNGHDGLETLREKGWALPLTRIQETQSGGQHVFFQNSPEARIRCSAGVLGDGIDIRADGGYVIWWTVEGYPLLCDEPPATLPDWLQDVLTRPAPRPAPPPGAAGVENTAKVRSALASLDPDMSYQDWVQVGMALHHATGGNAFGLALWDNWSAQGTKYKPGEPEKKWASFGHPGSTPVTLATLYQMATAQGWRWKDAKPAAPETRPAPAPPWEPLKPIPPPDWTQLLLKTKDGEIKDCPSNLVEIFDKHPDWTGRLRRNLFTGNSEIDEEELTDNIGAVAAHWCGITLKMVVKGLNNVFAALHLVASRHPYHPIVDYLENLRWDGIARINEWLIDYFGVVKTPYTTAIASKALLSAVARIYEPGVSVDTVLTMIGTQGIGKSAAWRILASPKWFSDSIADMHSKDAMQHLRGKWIVELAELSAMQRSELEAVKRFISCSSDSYRPSYGRHDQSFPRQCIFVATTNSTRPLKDTSGNRRWWPVEVTQELDLAALQTVREQLWAEAVTRYKAGESWQLDNGLMAQATIAQHERVEEDDWQEQIMEWLSSRPEADKIPVLSVYQDILGLKITDMTLSAQHRVGNIMRHLGWERRTIRHPVTQGVCKGYKKTTTIL